MRKSSAFSEQTNNRYWCVYIQIIPILRFVLQRVENVKLLTSNHFFSSSLQKSTMPAEKRQADTSFGSTEMVVKRQKAKYEGSEVAQINRTAIEKRSLILGVSLSRD